MEFRTQGFIYGGTDVQFGARARGNGYDYSTEGFPSGIGSLIKCTARLSYWNYQNEYGDGVLAHANTGGRAKSQERRSSLTCSLKIVASLEKITLVIINEDQFDRSEVDLVSVPLLPY